MEELLREIHEYIDDRINSKISVHVRFAVIYIMNKHNDVKGRDAPLIKMLAAQEVKRLSKAAIGRYEDATDETPEQMRLPGFSHLCKAYPVLRKGKRLLMPIELCDDHELVARRDQLRSMAVGCVEHSDEIDAYLNLRRRAA